MKKRIISAILLSTVVLSAAAPLSGVYADTSSDIQKQDATIASAQSAKAQAQAQVDSIQSKVDSLKTQQTDTQNKITKITDQAKKLNAQIEDLVQSIKERTDSLEAQARSAQVNSSSTNYLSAVLDSKSITDVIQKVTAIATVSNANQQMLKEQQREQKELEQKSTQVRESYKQFMALSRDLDSKAKELASQQADLKVATLNYQATITTAQDKKDALLAQKAQAEAAAQKAAEAQAAYEQQQQQSNQNSGSSNAGNSNGSGNSSSNNNGGNSSKPENGNNNNNSGGGYSGYNPYAGGGCTDYVWQHFASQGIYIANFVPGNGGDWATAGVGSGKGYLHVVGIAPGVIASGRSQIFVGTSDTTYGHVAIVTKVYSDGSFDVSEAQYSTGAWGVTRHISSQAGVTFLLPN